MHRTTKILLLGIGTTAVWIRSAECFQPTTAVSLPTTSRGTSTSSLSRARASELRVSEEDRERDLQFERELDRDAALWVNGDPKKQKLWDKAKTWRRVNQRECSRQSDDCCAYMRILQCDGGVYNTTPHTKLLHLFCTAKFDGGHF